MTATSLVRIRTLGAGALLLACVAASSAHAGPQAPATEASSSQAGNGKASSNQTFSNRASTGKTAPDVKPHSATAASPSHSTGAAHHTTAASGKRPLSHRKKTAKTRGQQKIDSERAQAIQEALIREHYLTGEASGKWNDATEAALRRYQSDNGWQSKTVPDSRALIRLGLGPSHDHLLNPDSAMTTSADAPRAAPLPPASHSTDPASHTNTNTTPADAPPAGAPGTNPGEPDTTRPQ